MIRDKTGPGYTGRSLSADVGKTAILPHGGSLVHIHPGKLLTAFLLLIALLIFRQARFPEMAPEGTGQETSDSVVSLTLLHFNDVYELMPVSGGTLGGLARVATLRDHLMALNPNTFTFFGGDLYWPSAMGTAIVDGTPLDGEHMVAAMNAVGIDFMVFGDHEFHVSSEDEFRQRLSDTQFQILSANIFESNGKSFPGVSESATFVAASQTGKQIKVGIFGLTEDLHSTAVSHQRIDAIEAAKRQVPLLRDQVDILIALTHQPIEDDIELAKSFPEIDLILGGDEHENMVVEAGQDLATIFKADSNVRSVYLLDIWYDTASGEFDIEPRMHQITDDMADDPATQKVVDHWMRVGFEAFRKQGIEPGRVISHAHADLDGFASSVRNHPTELTSLIATAMLNAAEGAELSFILSGLIRLDDLIPKGSAVTEYDVLRMMPMGDPHVLSVKMPGYMLKQMFNDGRECVGSGCFPVTANVSEDAGGIDWLIGHEPLNLDRTYLVAMTDRFFNRKLKDSDARIIQRNISVRDAITLQLTKCR